jgi:hypothetical protein
MLGGMADAAAAAAPMRKKRRRESDVMACRGNWKRSQFCPKSSGFFAF